MAHRFVIELIGGLFLLAQKLGARVNVQDLLMPWLED